MDKLREILVYRFWILLAVALIVPIVGWWIGSGDAAKAISARKGAIDSAYKAVPSGEYINDKWIEGANRKNEEQQKLIDGAWQKLAEGQIRLKTWPPVIAGDIAALGPGEEIPLDIRNIYYPAAYEREWAEVYLIVDPVRNGKLDLETNTAPTVGIVDFPVRKIPIRDWGDFAPDDKQMRDAQEDIWLFRSLLEAIADVNNGVENRAEAVITEIDSLVFLDDLLPKPALSKFAGPVNVEPPAPAAPSATTTDEFEDEGDDAMGLGRSSTNGIDSYFTGTSASFSQFFGKAAAPEQSDEDEDDNGFFGARAGGATSREVAVRRYVEDTPQYRTRAFNMVVKMDHLRLPDLLASLSNSPWPIKILRVEQTNGDTGNGRPISGFGGRGGFGRNFEDEDEGDDFYRAGQGRETNVRPHEAKIEITGTMRMFKSMAANDSSTGFNQTPAASTDAESTVPPNGETLDKPRSEPAPSFRSAELDDPELLRNITDNFQSVEDVGSKGRGRRDEKKLEKKRGRQR